MRRLVLWITVMMVGSYGYLSLKLVDIVGIPIVSRNIDQVTQVGTLGGDRIYDLIWSPDGRWLAVVGSGGRIYVYDSDDFSRPARLIQARSTNIRGISFTADSKTLSIQGDTWDIRSGRIISEFSPMREFDIAAQFSTISSTNNIIAVDHTFGLGIVDNTRHPHELVGGSYFLGRNGLSDITFSRDETQLAVSVAFLELTGDDRYHFRQNGTVPVWLWNVDAVKSQYIDADVAQANGDLLLLEGHRGGARQSVFSSDGSNLFTAGLDGKVGIWDTTSGTNLNMISAHYEAVWDVDISHDDTEIASVGWDGALRFWDSMTGTLLREKNDFRTALTSVAFHQHNEQVAIGSRDGQVWIMNPSTLEMMSIRGSHLWEPWDIDFSPDDRWLAVAADNHEIWLWNVQQRAEYRVLRGHQGPVQSLDFSPDGKYLVSGSMDQTVRVWDTERGQEIALMSSHSSSVRNVTFINNGRRILSTGYGGNIMISETASGEMIFEFPTQWSSPAISQDGHYIKIGNRLWNIVDIPFEVQPHQMIGIEMGASADKLNLMHDVMITREGFRDLESGEEFVPEGFFDNCTQRDVIFNHAGNLAASACSDGSIRLWGVERPFKLRPKAD